MASALDFLRQRLAALARIAGVRREQPSLRTAAPEIRTEAVLPEPLAFADLRDWCRQTGQRVEFVQGSDRYQVSAAGLALVLDQGRSLPVSPWLALPGAAGQPALQPGLLAPLGGEAPALEACFSVNGGPPAPWQAVAGALHPETAALLGDGALLLAHGLISPELLSSALDQVRPDEAVDTALFRLGEAPLSMWLEALVGKPRLAAASARPFDDRLGMRLLALRAITQGQLKQALAAQAQSWPFQPIGQLLGAAPAAVAKAASAQRPIVSGLAEADALGETLIRWGCVSRTDWVTAQRAGGDAAQRLVGQGKILPDHQRRAEAYRHNLQRLQASRRVRLGEILIEQGFDRQALGKALAWQVDQAMPLADLLLLHRLLRPVEAASALGAQADRYRALAEATLPALAGRPPALPALPPEPVPRRPLLSRRAVAFATLAALSLAYAVSYGARLHGAEYGWFDAFFPTPQRTAPPYVPPDEVVAQISRSHDATGPISVQPIGAIELPGNGPGVMHADKLGGQTPGLLHTPLPAGLGAFQASGQLPAGPRRGAAWPVAGSPAPLGHGDLAGEISSGAASSATLPSIPQGSAQGGAMPRGLQPAGGLPSAQVPAFGAARSPLSQPKAAFEHDRRDLAQLGRQASRQAARSPADARAIGTGPARQPAYGRQQGLLTATVHRSEAVFRAELGVAYFQRAALSEAAAEFSGAAHDDPTLALPHYYLGAIAERSGRRPRALAEYRAYLALAPNGEFAPAARSALAAR